MTQFEINDVMILNVVGVEVTQVSRTASGGVEIVFADRSATCLLGSGTLMEDLLVMPRPAAGTIVITFAEIGWRSMLAGLLAGRRYTVPPRSSS
jgi:hypothetical protein